MNASDHYLDDIMHETFTQSPRDNIICKYRFMHT